MPTKKRKPREVWFIEHNGALLFLSAEKQPPDTWGEPIKFVEEVRDGK